MRYHFIIATLLALCSLIYSVDDISMPTDYRTTTSGSRDNLADNFEETETKFNNSVDSLNQVRELFTGYTGNLTLTSQNNMTMQLDEDSSAVTHFIILEGTGDTLFYVREDSVTKVWGTLSVTDSLYVADDLVVGDDFALGGEAIIVGNITAGADTIEDGGGPWLYSDGSQNTTVAGVLNVDSIEGPLAVGELSTLDSLVVNGVSRLTGAMTMTGVLNVDSIEGPIAVGELMTVDSLEVNGASRFTQGITVTQTTTLDNALIVNGTSNLNSTVTVGADLTVNDGYNLAVDSIISSAGAKWINLVGTDTTEVQGDLITAGAMTVTNNLTIVSDTIEDGGAPWLYSDGSQNTTVAGELSVVGESGFSDTATFSKGTVLPASTKMTLGAGATRGEVFQDGSSLKIFEYTGSILMDAVSYIDLLVNSNSKLRLDPGGATLDDTLTVTQGLVIPTGTTPGPNTVGALFLDTDGNDTLKIYADGEWHAIMGF